MRLPLAYTARNLWVRKLTTALTALGMALVVYVYATVQMLSEGLAKTLVQTGMSENVVVIRRSAETEIQSTVDREQAMLVQAHGEIATDRDGQRLVSREVVVLVVLPKRGSEQPANVSLRGLSPAGLALRPQVRLVAGRTFRPGTNEVIAGLRVADGFTGAGLGESIRLGPQDWRVVGLFDAGNSAFASEIWGDVDQMMQAFRRLTYSAVIFRLADPSRFASVRDALEDDPRLTVEAAIEPRFYARQSELMAGFLRVLGSILSTIFSIGAVIGAMITMYASVASRTAEIGTLRALGFRRRDVLTAFLLEAMLLSLVGGVVGLTLASFMQAFTVSTMNWQTFSELAFSFTMNGRVVTGGLVFALVMGLAGGVLPAVKAARMNIVDALRAV